MTDGLAGDHPEVSILLALYDAANNCAVHGAVATVTLRGSAQIEGALQKPPGAGFSRDVTAHIKTETGWATVDVAEIAAVEVRRP